MMNWLYYLLEANFYMAVFYGFYRVLLQKDTYYTLNRYYLISTAFLAFALPLLQVGYLNDLLNNDGGGHVLNTSSDKGNNGQRYFNILLIWTYLLISTGFMIRFAYSLYTLLSLAARAGKHKEGNIVVIDLQNSSSAFSFFNLLFINPTTTGKQAIFKHEMVHISQHHSLDILLFEFIHIINWFNPIAWIIRKDIKLIHEYIADDITTISAIPKHEYAMLLIQNSFGNSQAHLTNQMFNQSILKRRINMLNQKKSAGTAKLKLLLTVPIAGSMLCASTLAFSKDYSFVDLYPEKYKIEQRITQDPEMIQNQDTSKKKQVKFPPPAAPPPPPKETKIKFPPPRVERVSKKQVIKFPPPIVTKDKIEKVNHDVPPPPPVEPPPPPPKKTDE